jgi:hypothetical protein
MVLSPSEIVENILNLRRHYVWCEKNKGRFPNF